MARIEGINVPNEKHVVISLTYIYGIGHTTAKKICESIGLAENTRTKDLTDEQLNDLRKAIKEIVPLTEGDLKRKVQGDIKALIEISCYRGIRHVKRLPVHGQRTHTNARTRKGRKAIAIAGKKKATK